MKAEHPTPHRGFTLIELMIGVAVLAILVAVAVPSFQDLVERRRVTAAAESVLSAMQFARSETIKQNTQVDVVFGNTGGAGWCYGLDDDLGTNCNCATTPANCTVAGETRVVSNTGANEPFPGVVLDTNFTGDRTGFTTPRGAATQAGTVQMTGAGGETLSVVASLMGRVRACSNTFAGYPDCGPGS